jgi:hypothetical protein
MSHSEGLEKRLRAVYDAFDQRNHKVRQLDKHCPNRHSSLHSTADLVLLTLQAAIKLCNAGLQKYPECYTFKSLKSVALERSGKHDEALQVRAIASACIWKALGPGAHTLGYVLV